MEPLWYYRLFGTEFGPLDTAKLTELHQGGTLGDTDEVRAADSPRWVTYQQAFAPAKSQPTPTTTVPTDSTSSPDDELNWYYLTLGQDLGPVSFNELRQLAEQGSLTAEDEIKFGADGKYRRIGSMGKLAAYLPYAPPAKPSQEKPTKKKNSDPVVAQVTTPPVAAAPVEAPVAPAVQYHPAAQEAAWFAYIRGVEYGPSSLVQLSQLFQTGQIAPTDFVKYGAYGQWMPPHPTIEQTLAQYIIATPTPAVTVAPVATTVTAPPVSTPVVAPAAKPVAASAPVTPAVAKSATPVAVPVVQPEAQKPTPPPVAKPSVAAVSDIPAEPAPKPQPVAASVVAPEPAPVRPAASGMASSTSPPAWSAPATPARPPAKSNGGKGVSFDFSALTSDPKMLGGVGFVAAVGLVLAFMFLLPAGTAGERAKLEQLQKVYAEFKQLREKKAPANEWEQFATTSAGIVDPIALELKDSASRQYPARQCLLWAARDRYKEMLQNAREKPTPQEEEFDYNLKKAANYLGLGPDPDLERATAAAQ